MFSFRVSYIVKVVKVFLEFKIILFIDLFFCNFQDCDEYSDYSSVAIPFAAVLQNQHKHAARLVPPPYLSFAGWALFFLLPFFHFSSPPPQFSAHAALKVRHLPERHTATQSQQLGQTHAVHCGSETQWGVGGGCITSQHPLNYTCVQGEDALGLTLFALLAGFLGTVLNWSRARVDFPAFRDLIEQETCAALEQPRAQLVRRFSQEIDETNSLFHEALPVRIFHHNTWRARAHTHTHQQKLLNSMATAGVLIHQHLHLPSATACVRQVKS